MPNVAAVASGRPSSRSLLAANVIVARAQARLSQSDLAERAGVARPTISRIERAGTDVGIDMLDRLATALGTTVAALLAPIEREGQLSEAELARRAGATDEFIDADALIGALQETGSSARYSKAGRPPVAR